MNSSFLSRIADRLILRSSRNPIDPEGRRRELVSTPHGQVEVWVTHNQRAQEPFASADLKQVDLVVLKFPGTAGRAERAGPHPFELIPQKYVELWTVNPIGYGGSQGRAAIVTTAATCESVWSEVVKKFPQTPIALVGNSLGCMSVLYLAARKEAAGIYLRNPVPVAQLISGRWKYNWWNFGLAAWIAKQVPQELDSIHNARRSSAPLLMISSERDRLCPWTYQQQVWSNYSGPKELLILQGADHHEGVAEVQVEEYRTRTGDFLRQIFV